MRSDSHRRYQPIWTILVFAIASHTCFAQTQEPQPSSNLPRLTAPLIPGPAPPPISMFTVESPSPDGSRRWTNMVVPGPTSPMVDELSWLSNRAVARELEIVDEQREAMAKIRKDSGRRMVEAANTYSPNGNVSERIAEIQNQQNSALMDVLLPHQQKRIKQIALQMRMQSTGTSNSLRSGGLADELEITDGQKKKLADLEEKWQLKIRKKMEEMRATARKELLNTLTAKQREEFEELVGDRFEHPLPVSPSFPHRTLSAPSFRQIAPAFQPVLDGG